MSGENEKLIRQWVEIANRQDGEALANLYHDDGVYSSPFGANEGKEFNSGSFPSNFRHHPRFDYRHRQPGGRR